FFQEGAVAMPSQRGLWFYPDGSLAFRLGFLGVAESLQKKGITGVELGVVRFDPQRVFNMGPRLFPFSFANQDCRQIDMRLCGTGIKTWRSGKFLARFIEPASFLQSGGVIEMRSRTNRKIGDDRGETFELTLRDAHLPEPEYPQGNDKNSHPFRAVQGPIWEKAICRNVGCAAADAERLSSGFL